MARSGDYNEWLIGRLKRPLEAAHFLQALSEDGDQAAFRSGMRKIIAAQGGMAGFARKVGISRVGLYKMLAKNGNPGYASVEKILRALGLKLSFQPAEPPAKARKRAAV